MSLLDVKVNESVFVEIKAFGKFTKKDGEQIDKFDVVNLETGEDQTMWVDGGLRGALSAIGGPEGAINKKVEIKRGPKKEFTDDNGEILNVNSYDVWELEN